MIASGHAESDIGDYPLDKFLAYVESVRRTDALRRHDAVIDMLAAISGAFGGKKSSISEFLETFREQAGV